MVKDKKEQERPLSPAEERRLAGFEAAAAELAARGYRRTDLTVGIAKANLIAVLLTIPVFAAGLWLFFSVNGFENVRVFSGYSLVLFLGGTALLTVVHELVHGLVWSFFTPRHFKDVEFGIMIQYVTPYCACTAPLKKGPYIAGALAPLFAVGVLPAAIAILIGSFPLLMLGLVMILAAAGDMMIVKNILAHRSVAREILYMDHPTQAGGVIFEK